MAREIGWQVTVADARSALVTADRLPGAATIVIAPEIMDEHVELAGCSVVFVMIHRFAEDLALLRLPLVRPLGYLGILGPRTRTEHLLAGLRAVPVATLHG